MARLLRVDRLYLQDTGQDNAASLNTVLNAVSAWFNAHQDQADPMAGFTWPPPKTRLPGSNQDVINLFARAAGRSAYVDWLARAGILASVSGNRAAPYQGPALEDLAGLTAAERAALQALLPKPAA